tara:strand:- start:853 stop:1263 length:411 start_codon:yes stop_codon:yes gene_type:complete
MLKISHENTDKINLALKKTNQSATTHTYTQYYEISSLVDEAERELNNIDLPKSRQTLVKYVATSGGSVSNSYKFQRKITKITLLKRKAGWYILSLDSAFVYPNCTVRSGLHYTQAQIDFLCERFRDMLRVQRSKLL